MHMPEKKSQSKKPLGQQKTWKLFDQNPLTHSAAHYLMTIQRLIEEQGYARVTDTAKELNITPGSCSISIKALRKKGLIEEDDNKFLRLSDDGVQLVHIIRRNDELLEIFFRDVLGVDPWQAEIDACKIEHLISIETSMQLATFIDLIQSDKKIAKDFLAALKKKKK